VSGKPDHNPQSGEWSTPAMLKVCAVSFAVLTAIFLPFPEIDTAVAHWFYLGEGKFYLSDSLFTAWKNDYIRPGIGFVAIAGLLYFLYRRLTDPAHKVGALRRWSFFLLSIVLSTGFVVHAIFKDQFGRARPEDIIGLGGDKIFTPPLLPADQCVRNCSFVSGDASLGFAFLALALFATQWRKGWILVTLALGLALGATRIMNGSHFLSDILYSGVFTCGTVLLLYRWWIEGHWAEDTAGVRRMLTPVWGGFVMLGERLSTPGLRARIGRARIRLRRLLEPLL
jgi:lipid A 4'-phosphatase